MRRFAIAALALLLCALPAAAAEPPRIVIDHEVFIPPPDSLPFIQHDRTLVPLRAIFEHLGAQVHWDGQTQTVTARRGATQIRLTIDSAAAYVNGQPVTLEQPALLRENRTFVPLRFVSEAFGANVQWYESSSPEPWMTPIPKVAITTYSLPQKGAPLSASSVLGALERITLPHMQPLMLRGEGIGLLHLTSRETEFYRLPDAAPRTAGYGASADGRFVIARTIQNGYLHDRISGDTQRWNRLQHELVLAGHESLLFQAVAPNPAGWITTIDPIDGQLGGYLAGTEQFLVTTSALREWARFALPAGTGRPLGVGEAIWNPDENRLMLSWGESSYLVDLGTSTVTRLSSAAKFQAAKGGTEVIALQAGPHGTQVTRYDWNGQALVTHLLPSEHVQLSADGEWAAWEVFKEEFTPVVYISKLGTEESIQALGATMCYGLIGRSGNRWGDGLIVSTREGLRSIGTDGEMKRVPNPEGVGPYEPIPAPGRKELLAYRRVTALGVELGVVTPESPLAIIDARSDGGAFAPSRVSPLWGATSDVLRFTVTQQYGTGGPCGDYSIPLPLQVGTGTVDSTLALQVVAPGDCVNLREQPWFEAPVIRCLPDGSRIEIGNHSSQALPRFHHNDDGQWFQLPEGWIRVDSGLLQFAP